MKWVPAKYQTFAKEYVIKNDKCGLFLDMGLGKTSIVLTAVWELIFWYRSATKILVIAPKRVAENVWTDERDKWGHLQKLQISVVSGTERQRIKALNTQAHIYTISRDNFAWLVALYSTKWPFDMIVVDESSSFKNHASVRFKAMKKILPFTYRRIILTGTPAPNGLIDLWTQIFILDEGERLGPNITWYRDNLFKPDKAVGPHVFKYVPQNGTTAKIQRLIKDVVISMDAADYQKLPKLIERNVEIEMPPNIYKAYKKFEREKIIEIIDQEITAINAAVLSGKLQQFANGFLYDENKTAHDIHNLKMEAIEEIVEGLNGQPLLLFYWFKHDLNRLCKRFKHLQISHLKNGAEIKAWNDKKISLALVHPASVGHGLNLQVGGNHIAWFGPIWNAELYAQALKRLHRPGQQYTVLSHTAVMKGTIDTDIAEARTGKISLQNALIKAVRARIKEYRN